MSDAAPPAPAPPPPGAPGTLPPVGPASGDPASPTGDAGPHEGAPGDLDAAAVLGAIFREAPSSLHVLRDPDFVFEFANERFCTIACYPDGYRAAEGAHAHAVGPPNVSMAGTRDGQWRPKVRTAGA